MRLIDIDDDRICYCGEEGEYSRYNIPQDVMDEAITVHPEPPKIEKWIPCKERLPEESGMYLVSGKRKVWVCEFTKITVAGVKIGGWANDASNPVVTAWLPLPEPYTKEEEDGND